ncbi:MAG: hypothetical protein U0U67_02305 [Chitinophagales bacterium]
MKELKWIFYVLLLSVSMLLWAKYDDIITEKLLLSLIILSCLKIISMTEPNLKN